MLSSDVNPIYNIRCIIIPRISDPRGCRIKEDERSDHCEDSFVNIDKNFILGKLKISIFIVSLLLETSYMRDDVSIRAEND